MRTKLEGSYTIHIPEEDFKDYVKEKAASSLSDSNEFEITEITYDPKENFIYLHIELYKRMDA
jgi:hypothetical protein